MSPQLAESPWPEGCDVLVIGAGLAGVAVALQVAQRLPAARILVLDKARELPRSGTSEFLSPLSALYFSRVLMAEDLLLREHLPATAVHAWFAREATDSLSDMTEIGWRVDGPQLAHHVETARLRQGLLQRARALGVDIRSGCTVKRVELQWPLSTIHVEEGPTQRVLRARWVIDGSGRAALLAKQLELQTTLAGRAGWSAVANWTQLRELDSAPEIEGAPQSGGRAWSRSRRFASQHFAGDGWHVRVCPHPTAGASVQLFVQADARSETPRVNSLEGYSRFVRSKPGLRELLRGARLEPQSFRANGSSDWTTQRRCARGYWLVGDAAASLTRSYASPLERVVRDARAAAQAVLGDLAGADSEERTCELLEAHEIRARAEDALEAAETFRNVGALGADAAVTANYLRMLGFFESREVSIAARDPFATASRTQREAWLGSARRLWLARLRRVAQLRHAAGTAREFNRGRRMRLGGRLAPWSDMGLAIYWWARLEYGCLRENLRPVENDTRRPASIEVARRAAEELERSFKFRLSTLGLVGDRGGPFQ